MTREEQIKAAAKKTTGLFSYRNGYSTAEDAFIAGAEWADANQPNPWISVEERLPDRHPAKFVNWSKEVFVAVKRGREYRAYVDKYSHIYKTWGVFGDEVTHWIPIPELPKEEKK